MTDLEDTASLAAMKVLHAEEAALYKIGRAERLAVLEQRVNDMKSTLDTMDKKMDDLLALRNKGAGIFWLFSAFFAASVVTLTTLIMDWIHHA